MRKANALSGRAAAWAWGAFAMGCAGLAAGCYPGGPTDLSELDEVVTSFDDTFDFSQPATFSLPDSVANIGDPDESGYVELSDDYDTEIIQYIAAELTAYGWTRVANRTDGSAATADILVLPSKVGSTTWVLSSYYPGGGYWGWYYPYYPAGGWGWYYPPVYTASSYETGTLFVDMTDPNSYDPIENTVAVRCTGTLSAVLGASVTDTDVRLQRGIHQAFVQSPYLKRN